MTVMVTDAPPDEHGRDRFHWRATLGGGTRAGWEYDEAKARERGDAAERHLLAVETHDPEVMDEVAEDGMVYLRKPNGGGVVGVSSDVATDLLASGYERVENPALDEESEPERQRRRARRAQQSEPEPDGDGDEM